VSVSSLRKINSNPSLGIVFCLETARVVQIGKYGTPFGGGENQPMLFGGKG
jgi:hypothetical protein